MANAALMAFSRAFGVEGSTRLPPGTAA